MSNLRQAAQQALEAWFRPHGINYVDFKPYMEALKQALAEPEQEPFMVVAPECAERGCMAHDDRVDGYGVVLHFREKQEPQTTHWEGCEAVHPECRTEQEPDGISWLKRDSGYFTAPTPRRPLTEEEIALIVAECSASAYRHDDFSFARAIERAHGIGEQHDQR